ncbi:MAG: endonuclease domain-containing protein [Bacteroidetes bacterium]|nr:endonuclease domain-containing protein [Bacteroidota bacterium]
MKFFNRSENKKLRKELRLNQPKAEQVLWQKIKAKRFLGIKFRRQHGIGPFIIDFYNTELKLAIEIDGDSHFNEESLQKDNSRTNYLEKEGIEVLRFTNTDVYKNIGWVLEQLKIYIENKIINGKHL